MKRNSLLEDFVMAAIVTQNRHELALGFVRYEALRKLSPNQFAELCKRNLNGERFDDMMDELVEENQ